MSTYRPVIVVAGLGAGGGTGAAVARLFAKEKYSVALIARGADSLKSLADDINQGGGQAASFPIESYSAPNVASAWAAIREKYPAPEYSIRVAVFNAGQAVWKPFLDITTEDIRASSEANIEGSFAFAREAILSFKENKIDDEKLGKRGALIFTGATASIRGNTTTSLFAAGKFALRALSQSLSKEFGKDNIHVSHAIIDGGILTPRSKNLKSPEWAENLDGRLSPESIASSYWYLANQDRTAWTWELDLRPAHEKW